MTAKLSPHLALADTFRRSGWHKLGRRELELKLGRSLTKFERRAFDIAAHIDSGVESIATQSSKANQRIVNAKGLRLPKPTDPNNTQDTGHATWAGKIKSGSHARYSIAGPSVNTIAAHTLDNGLDGQTRDNLRTKRILSRITRK